MKRFFNILILLFLGLMVYQYRIPILENVSVFRDNIILLFAPPPCEGPIPYDIGTFDLPFNISKEYFLDAVAEAERIWEDPLDRELFSYTPGDQDRDVLKINLIYDYRQQATDNLEDIGIVVKDDKASYEVLKSKFDLLKGEYTVTLNNYSPKVALFEKQKVDYEKEVNFWNQKGGAPEKEFNKIEIKRLALLTSSEELQIIERQINKMVDEMNAMDVELNHLAKILNLSVEKYNTINGARGETFEGGVYISEGRERQIDIYEFSSREKLVRVLAHELGHALGIGHLSDPKAIMYEFNQDNSEVLTEADLSALRIQCGVE